MINYILRNILLVGKDVKISKGDKYGFIIGILYFVLVN